MTKPFWYVVTSQGSDIALGVFGSALYGMAVDCKDLVTRNTGFPAFLRTVEGPRPSVGDRVK